MVLRCVALISILWGIVAKVIAADDWWAFQPIEKPVGAIDAIVSQEWTKQGLKPAPRASADTLIRRLHFDLTGLPPTPGEVAAFVADSSPAAYEKVVDRLCHP